LKTRLNAIDLYANTEMLTAFQPTILRNVPFFQSSPKLSTTQARCNWHSSV